jgi:hypothetical protein
MTVAVLLAVSSPAFAVTGVPSAPVDLSFAGQGAYSPQVSIDSTGLAIAVWSRSGGLIQSRTSQSGGAWSTSVDVSVAGLDSYSPQVSIDSAGLAIAVWIRKAGTRYIIQSSTSQSGGAWSTPVDVSVDGPQAYSPQVGVDSAGRATAVWFRLDGGHYIIQSSTSQSGGAWSTPVDVSVAGQNAYSPQVSSDSTGRATAVWYRFDGSNNIIQSSTSQSGGTWSTPVNLSAIGRPAFDPQVSIDSTGRATAVWYRFDGSNNIIQSSTSQSGGAWSTPVDVSVAGQNAVSPQVSIDSAGRATAVWYRYDGSNNIIQSSTSQSGGAWSTPVDVSVAGQNAFSPQVSIDSTGRAIAVWYRYDGSNDIIQSSTSQSGGAWSIPVVVSAAGQDAYDPQVSIDAAGLAVIVWNRYDGSKDRIQSSTIDNPIASTPVSTPISASAPELAKTGTNRHDSGVLAMGTAALLILGVGGTLLTRRTKNLK